MDPRSRRVSRSIARRHPAPIARDPPGRPRGSAIYFPLPPLSAHSIDRSSDRLTFLASALPLPRAQTTPRRDDGVRRPARPAAGARRVRGRSRPPSPVRRRRRRRRSAVVVITRTGVAGPYTHESRHLLISNASHMYNERNRLTRQVSRAPLAPRAPRHRRVLSRPHKRVVLVERAPVRLGTLHEFSHRVVPLEPVRFRGPEQHV